MEQPWNCEYIHLRGKRLDVSLSAVERWLSVRNACSWRRTVGGRINQVIMEHRMQSVVKSHCIVMWVAASTGHDMASCKCISSTTTTTTIRSNYWLTHWQIRRCAVPVADIVPHSLPCNFASIYWHLIHDLLFSLSLQWSLEWINVL